MNNQNIEIKMMLQICTLAGKDYLVDQLEEQVTNYKIAGTKRDYSNLIAACQLVIMKDMVDQIGAEVIMKKIEEKDFTNSLFNTSKN